FISLGGYSEASPCSFDIPVQDSDLPLVGVVLHFEVSSGGNNNQVCYGSLAQDALI
ncbi:hypothetical protein L195_g064097, partial [Trifolium pratense]